MRFFSPEEEQRIIEAIRAAEGQTSGEIRVHVDRHPQRPALEEAVRMFSRLGMHQTQARNGVLILISPQRREFAIIGDEGIHALVGDDFWQAERDLMQASFRQGQFVEGLAQAIAQVGEKLKQYFPRLHDDANELSDEVSYDD
jgi:uncharacterized membrane protein